MSSPAQPVRRPLVALGCVLALAATTSCSGHPASAPTMTSSEAASQSPAAGSSTTPPQGHNRSLAMAEASKVLATVPVPPGATPADSPPAPRLRRLWFQMMPIDPTLTRTTWWVVPLSYGELVSWYGSHPPANARSFYDPGSFNQIRRGDEFAWQVQQESRAYTEPGVVVAYARLSRHTTAIRIDVTLASKYDRTPATLVPTSAARVDVSKASASAPHQPLVSASVTDPAMLSRIVSAFDSLEGATANTGWGPCASPVSDMYVYAMVFHWPGHTLAVDPGQALCGVGMGLTLDDTALPQTLQDDHALDRTLSAALKAA